MLNKDLKVGQRVKCIKSYEENSRVVGLIGKVLGKDSGIVGIEFISPVSCHDSSACGTSGREGYCWNFDLHSENFIFWGSLKEEIE